MALRKAKQKNSTNKTVWEGTLMGPLKLFETKSEYTKAGKSNDNSGERHLQSIISKNRTKIRKSMNPLTAATTAGRQKKIHKNISFKTQKLAITSPLKNHINCTLCALKVGTDHTRKPVRSHSTCRVVNTATGSLPPPRLMAGRAGGEGGCTVSLERAFAANTHKCRAADTEHQRLRYLNSYSTRTWPKCKNISYSQILPTRLLK